MWTRADSRRRCAAFTAAMLLALPASGQEADGFDPYVVRGFEAAAQAESGASAKDAAIEAAVTEGLRIVVSRVGSAEAAARMATPERAMSLLDYFSIDTEHIAPVSYRASLDLHYSAIGVRGILQRQGVKVVDQPAPETLLIPVLEEDGVPLAWEDADRWRAALEAVDFTKGLTPVVLPRNSREDKRERLSRLLNGDRVSLDTYRVRYRVQGVVIALAGTTAGRERVAVRLVGEDGAGPIGESLSIDGGGLDAAALEVARLLSERWKAGAGGAPMAGAGTGAALPVRILLRGGAGGWDAVRAKLEASGAISAVSVEVPGETTMNVLLWHSGDPRALPARLAAQGLDLFEAGGTWLLQAY